MIRCRILGPIGLSGADGQPLDDVLAQPRRLALLAYLAMQSPRGFTRRDALFPLFWPELDQDRARGALRQALHVLRAGLGDGVLISRGSEAVALSPDAFWCDATEFERACDDRQWAAALDLYRGDFLESFFISEAPQFEQWMQEQQGHLRLRATAAARSLAAEQEAAGALTKATASIRRALAWNGADEESFRQLLTLLDRQGDRVGAVHEYEAFVARLSEEYGVPPSAETSALFERIRQREHVLRPEAAPDRAVESEQKNGAPSPAPARRRRMWAVAASVLLLGGLMLWQTVARLGAADPLERVVILPFDVRAAAEHAYLREALVDLLSTGLDGAGGIQTIDPNAVRAAAGAMAEAKPADGREIARRLDARYFVLGRAVVAGTRLRVQSSLYDVRAGDAPIAQASREGAAEQLFDIVDALAADLLVASQRSVDVRLSKSAALTTRSLPALKAYLEGERAFQKGDLAQSADALRRAVTIDTTFALADYRLSVVVDAMNGAWTEVQETAERALRHANRLSERDRLLLKAHMASVAEDVVGAEQQYRFILARYPDELEAWYRLAEVIFHQNATMARPLTDARAPFERLLQLDPTNLAALQHLSRIAAVERRTDDLDGLYRRIVALKLSPAEEAEARALRVFTGGSASEREKFIAEQATASPGAMGLSTWVTAIFARDLGATERMLRAWTSPTRTATERSNSHAGIARLHAIRGRFDSAAVELREVERVDPSAALEQGAFFTILSFRAMPVTELRAWRSRVAAWKPPRADASTMNNNDVTGPWRPHIRLYLLGELDALLHDTAAARADADSLERIAVPALPDAAVFARELAVSVRAHTLWRQGKGRAALALLEGGHQARPYPYRASRTRTQDRYVRAELLYEAGRHADALVWYGSFEYTSVSQLVYATPAHLRRGQIYERLGDPAHAAAHYRRFLELWGDADPPFRPLTSVAEERLRQLGPT